MNMNRISIYFFILMILVNLKSDYSWGSDWSACKKAQKLSKEASRASPDIAEKNLLKAIDLCKESTSLKHNLALVFYKQKKYTEAKDMLNKVIEINPSYAKALNALAVVYLSFDESNPQKALELADRALKIENENNHFRDTYNKAKDAISAMDVNIPPDTNIKNPDAVAVVIGNRDYENKDVPPVEYAIKDANTMREYLIKTMGFKDNNIIFKTNAKLSTFREIFGAENKGALYNYVKKGKSEVFIYYSGHGGYDTNNMKDVYFISTDANPNSIANTGYSLDLFNKNIAQIINENQLKKVVVVIDSCFSGGSNTGMLIKGASPIVIVINPKTAFIDLDLPNTAVFTSASGSQISSWYKEKEHSLFTYFFFKAIKDNVSKKGKITVGEIESYIKEDVSSAARRLYGREQVPELNGNKDLILVGNE